MIQQWENRLYPIRMRRKAARARRNQPSEGIKKVRRIPIPIQNNTNPISCFMEAHHPYCLLTAYALLSENVPERQGNPCRFWMKQSGFAAFLCSCISVVQEGVACGAIKFV